MKKFINEFKEFAIKGNMIDMAIGIIIGGTFTTIVKSLVDNIFMPIIGLATKGVDLTNMFISLNGEKYATLAEAEEAGAALIKYGQFITDIIYFILLTFIVFCFVKQINKFRAAMDAKKPVVEEAPTEKECPHCFTKISIKATRCPHCTSELKD